MVSEQSFLSGGVIDAVHAHVCLSIGQDMRPWSTGPIEGREESAYKMAEVVRWMGEADPTCDSFLLAATYAWYVIKFPVYRTARMATALMLIYVVLARENLRLVPPEEDLVKALFALRMGDIKTGQLATWLRGHGRIPRRR